MDKNKQAFNVSVQGKNGILSGPPSPQMFDVSRGLPGRRKWVKDRLVFEPTRANIEYLKRSGLDINWDNSAAGRLDELKRIQDGEELARDIMSRPLEALKWDFKTDPYDHQAQGFALCKDRDFFALFLEMGLGKTKVIIDVAAYKYSMGRIDTLIILAPNGVHKQWIDEQLPLHMPEFVEAQGAWYASGMRKAEQTRWDEVKKYGGGLRVLALNIETIQNPKGYALVEALIKSGRAMLVIDESVRIKDQSAARTKHALKLAKFAECRFIMSGAPVTQGVQDLYTQLKFLDDDILGYSSFYSFRDHFCTMGGFEGKEIIGYRNLDELTHRLALHSFRATKRDCLDLPEKIYVQKPVELTDEQRRMYKTMKDEAYAAMSNGMLVTVEHAMLKVLKLQQILSGFLNETDPDDKVVTQHTFPSKRASVCADVVEEAQDKVIVWCRFIYDIDQVCEELKRRKIKFREYSGRIDTLTRSEALADFKFGDTKVLIGTARAGGTGLNLTEANTMIYYSNDFNADTRWQSEDRIHRIGQSLSCTYIDLVTKGTVDTHILAALRTKKSIANMTLGELKAMLKD